MSRIEALPQNHQPYLGLQPLDKLCDEGAD